MFIYSTYGIVHFFLFRFVYLFNFAHFVAILGICEHFDKAHNVFKMLIIGQDLCLEKLNTST